MFPQKEYQGVQGGRYYLVQTIPQFEEMMSFLLTQRMVAVDTETTGLNWVTDDVCGIVLGAGVANNYYIPIRHQTTEKQLNIDAIRTGLKLLFENTDISKILFNAKFDLHGLRKLGLEVKGAVHDVLIMAFLHDENGEHGLKSLSNALIDKNADKWESSVDEWRTNEAKRRRLEFSALLKTKQTEIEVGLLAKYHEKPDLATKRQLKVEARAAAKVIYKDHPLSVNKKDQITYDYLPLNIITPYACADTHYTWLLFKKYLFDVCANSYLKDLYANEIRLLKLLLDTEKFGLKVDTDYLEKSSPTLTTEISRLAQEVYDAIGYEFNIDSDAALIKAFNKAGVVLVKYTKASLDRIKKKLVDAEADAKFSVDKEVLEGLATKYKFARSVLHYRQACKLKSTYVDSLLAQVDDHKFVHSTFNQNVSTGRMSSNSPNLQNLPARNKSIRKAFIVPSDEYVFVFIDFSQIEIRLTAHLSEDPVLLSCYPRSGAEKDVHSITCADVVMDVPLEKVLAMKNDKTGHNNDFAGCDCPACLCDFYRNIAKRVGFGIIYGAGPATIQRQVSTPERYVSKEQCGVYIDKYFVKYRGVKDWIDYTSSLVRRQLYVENVFGRRRRFPNFANLFDWQKDRAVRQGVNFMVQGAAADFFKLTATRVADLLVGKKTRIVNLVHDELQFYWHKDELDLIPKVKAVMEDWNFRVPIIAEVSYADRDWAGKQPYKL